MSVTVDGRSVTPSIIEPSYGIDRIFLSVLVHAFYIRDSGFKVLKLQDDIAPYHAAVLPLVNKDGMDTLARDFYENMKKIDPYVMYDQSGSIGRRYARQDEIGTPYCITFDSQSTQDGTVTVRERDSARQIRVSTQSLLSSGILQNKEIRSAFRSS